MINDPAQWRMQGKHFSSHLHPTYPTDGRETVHAPYEAIQPTNTVAGYRRGQERVAAHDPSLPHDYEAYLAQRVPSAHKMGELPSNTGIDRFGQREDA